MKFVRMYIALFFIAFTLTGCGGEKRKSAEDIGVEFFDALYNQKNFKKALSLCSPNFAQELQKHRTVKQVSRRVFNMSFERVEIHTGLGDFKIREEFQSAGNLTLLFTGIQHGKKVKELKNSPCKNQ